METQKNMASWLKCGEFYEKELGHSLEGSLHLNAPVQHISIYKTFSEEKKTESFIVLI